MFLYMPDVLLRPPTRFDLSYLEELFRKRDWYQEVEVQ